MTSISHAEKQTLVCLRCGHSWVPRTAMGPGVCPRCNSAYWDIPPKKLKKATEDK